jgi:hypothetical protein
MLLSEFTVDGVPDEHLEVMHREEARGDNACVPVVQIERRGEVADGPSTFHSTSLLNGEVRPSVAAIVVSLVPSGPSSPSCTTPLWAANQGCSEETPPVRSQVLTWSPAWPNGSVSSRRVLPIQCGMRCSATLVCGSTSK